MGKESHIVRFKVTTLECTAMPNGQQYTIYYRRGDVARSTPCYIAQDGVVDFTNMPEGASVVHFKSGRGQGYAPKLITMRIEEYTRGQPRRTVGQTEIDCSRVVRSGYQGSGICVAEFRMYGVMAKISVAVLVYPRSGAPLSFDGLITENPTAKRAIPKGNIKTMERGEAMTLLISLETMLERRKTETKKAPSTPLEIRLQELEDKRKKLTSTQGLAAAVVKARTQDVIEAQFTAMSYKCRDNYIGESAAYFRQMAIASGGVSSGGANLTTMKQQLENTESRLQDLQGQMQKLNEEQEALGRIQHKTDVTQELIVNLDKVSAVENQIKMLNATRDSLKKELGKQETKSNPLQKEISALSERIKTLQKEQQEAQTRIKHMSNIATTHVLSWARGKNPPEPTIVESKKATDDDLFNNKSDDNLQENQRKAILNAFKGIQASAPPPTARSVSSSSSSDNNQDDLFGNAPGLPSAGDFGGSPKESVKKPAYQDPLKPSGMGVDMFSAKPDPKPTPAAAPSFGNEFNFASTTSRPEQPVTFDYSAVLNSAQEDRTPAFSFEPMQSSPIEKPSQPAYQASPSEPQGVTAPAASQDPYYDDIDDYTVPPDIANPPAVEFGEGFTFGTEDPVTTTPPAASSAAPARPTFSFGPSEVEDTGAGTGTGASVEFTGGKPEYDFGGGFGSGETNTDNKPSGGYGGLPTYNFGS